MVLVGHEIFFCRKYSGALLKIVIDKNKCAENCFKILIFVEDSTI